jgi:hypothetical protein
VTGPPDWAATGYRPCDVIRDLVTLLRGHGLNRLYWSGCALLAVLSVTPTLTVWCDGRYLTCRHGGTRATWPATGTTQAAHDLAALARTTTPKENPDDPHSAA